MKLGISYNLFDGEELLEGSINCIRKYVDFISVVYQTVSNFGNKANPNLVDYLMKIKSNKLIDELYEYIPTTFHGAGNEIEKRNIGLQLSRNVGCSHHMSIDADEYYLGYEFKHAKEKIIKNDNDASFCPIINYYKTWEYIIKITETVSFPLTFPPYVSMIYKIKPNSQFLSKGKYVVLIDPTRKIQPINNPIIFERNEIQMHHGSYIRNDISIKLINSSANKNFNEEINTIIDYYSSWNYPDQALWAGKPTKLYNVEKIQKQF
jgi:hypothetical protein